MIIEVDEAWFEQRDTGPALLIAFDPTCQSVGSPVPSGEPFTALMEGGCLALAFVAQIKGRAVYAATPQGREFAPAPHQEPFELVSRELLRASL